MQSIIQDIRFALRMFARRPGLTITALVCLSLGIGATTSVYSVVSAYLLRPYPYPEPERLTYVTTTCAAFKGNMAHSVPDFMDYRKQNKTFEDMALTRLGRATLVGTAEPERVTILNVTHSFLSVLGVKPLLGRSFLPEENKTNGNGVVILTYDTWQRHYGGDPNVIGKKCSLDGYVSTIIGVLPSTYFFPFKSAVLAPQVVDSIFTPRGNMNAQIIGRLKKHVSLEQASADLTVVMHRFPKDYYLSAKDCTTNVLAFRQMLRSETRRPMLILLGAVVLVLLIAGINVANLLLVAGVERRQEITMRTALGAGRWRIVRQVLTENMLLSLVAWGIGLLLASWGEDIVISLLPRSEFYAMPGIGLDHGVLAVTLGGTLLLGILFGLPPALQASRLDLQASLQEGGTRATMGRKGLWVRNALVVAEIALALLLVTAAGLMTRTFNNLLRESPGFEPKGLLTVGVSLPPFRKSEQETKLFYDTLTQRIAKLPGVESVGNLNCVPLTENNWSWAIEIEGRPPAPSPGYMASLWIVNGDYFRVMGIPLIKGRTFNDRDTTGSTPVVIISESMARRFWPNESPIGKHIKNGPKYSLEVVGVVGDVHDRSLSRKGEGATYRSSLQNPSNAPYLMIRTKHDPLGLAGAVRREVQALDKTLALDSIQTMDDIVMNSLAMQRTMMVLSGLLAGLAFVLAIAGVYGVMAYSVTQRSHEFGIRMAVGAGQQEIMRLVILRGLRLVAVGIGIGLAATLASMRLLANQLYGVSPNDPLTLGGVSILLVCVAIAACYFPARWATRVQPMMVLRQE